MLALLYSFILKKLKSIISNRLIDALKPKLIKIFNTVANYVVTIIGKVSWQQKHEISLESKIELQSKLTDHYYIIATRRGNHLSTFFIGLANFVLTFKWGYFSHVLMNLEDEVNTIKDFRFIEATGTGVNYSTFDNVFAGVDAVALLKPKVLSLKEWTKAMDKAKMQLGKPYDTLFDLKNDTQLSCVELIRVAMSALPDYDTNFAHFEELINKSKNLTPQMFLQCDDFEIVYLIKG